MTADAAAQAAGNDMTQHALLDNVSHKDLRVHRVFEPGCGYDANVARVFPAEFEQLQMEYPLFLFKNAETGHFESVALLGFADGENLFLDGGRWDARYMPLSIERQPLLIGFQEQDVDGVPTRVPVVHVDLGHPSASTTEGEPLFLPQGGESPLLERLTSVLKAVHDGHEASQAFSQLLVGLDLVETLSIDVRFDDGSRQSLAGLHTINEEKLASLGGDALEALHQPGHLRRLYMMLASLPNLEKLIARKNARLAARA